MPKFTPVKPSRFSDTIAAQLKNAILIRDYKPDEKLPSEKELTETFQASRVVVGRRSGPSNSEVLSPSARGLTAVLMSGDSDTTG